MTKADKKRLDIIHRLPCMACVQIGANITPVEAHHIVDKGYRKHSGGHQATIPLCEWHHRGEMRLGMTATSMAEIFGPSLARSKRKFVARYGTERELLEKVNELIKSGERRPRVGKAAAAKTPIEFRDMLISIARTSAVKEVNMKWDPNNPNDPENRKPKPRPTAPPKAVKP